MRVSFYLTRPQASESGIYARLCYAGNKIKYYLPEAIQTKFWNTKSQRAKQSSQFSEYPEFNARLDNFESKIKTVYRRIMLETGNEIPSGDVLRKLLDVELKAKDLKKAENNFLVYFAELIDATANGLRHNVSTGKPISKSTLKSYQTTYNHLLNYQKANPLQFKFDDITQHFYDDYKKFLTQNLKQSANTIGKDFKIIKMVLNDATEKGIKTNPAYKSKRFAVIKHDVDSIYLSETELQEMASLDLTDKRHLEKVRDQFLIGCFTGLRFSDFSTLNAANIIGDFIQVKQIKTNRNVAIPLHPIVKRILKKYGEQLPEGISNQKTNDYLKIICKEVECLKVNTTIYPKTDGLRSVDPFKKYELVTTHTARRSFATNQFLAGVPPITIMAITGHSKESSFMKYIKLASTDHAKVLQANWHKKSTLEAVK